MPLTKDKEVTAAAAATTKSPADPTGDETDETTESQADTAAVPSSGPAPVVGATRIVAAPLKAAEYARAAAEPTQPLDESGDDDIEIELGEDIAAVIARFGQPSMVLKGISGRAYTEKYTFRTKEGRKIVVLALNGKVTAITPEPLRLAARR